MFACLHSSSVPAVPVEALAELAREFSPSVEIAGAETVLFSVDGLERLIGSHRQIAAEIARKGAERGVHPNLAMAGNPDAALQAARYFAGTTIIPPGEEARALGAIPLQYLAIPLEMREALESWGVRTFHEFAQLPPLGVVERFGAEGLRLQDKARGCFRRPLELSREKAQFERHLDLEHPLDNLQPLLFLVNGMLTELCRQMRLHGVAASELKLRLELEGGGVEERAVAFVMPMRESGAMLKLLQLQLDSGPPQGAITGVALVLIPVEPRTTQHGLFSGTSPEPANLAITLARIENIVGAGRVGTAELLDTHRPDAFRMRAFSYEGNRRQAVSERTTTQLVMRVYRPALRARVLVEGGHPRRVSANGITGNVTHCAGPWRSSGDWWTEGCWDRDEWDVSLSEGGLYRIYRADGWYVAGVYD